MLGGEIKAEPLASSPCGISSGRSWEYDEWMGRQTRRQEERGAENEPGGAGKRPGFIRRRIQAIISRRLENIEPRLAAGLIWAAPQNDEV
ncbi:MAG: hypothetical protein M1530_02010 [Candidatus Marsarchaeota archaeon]|nr:hypothetical protein [Candidatus Marsarchaeota archaeon]